MRVSTPEFNNVNCVNPVFYTYRREIKKSNTKNIIQIQIHTTNPNSYNKSKFTSKIQIQKTYQIKYRVKRLPVKT